MEPAETALERLARELGAILPKNSNTATININAGGVALWLASLMAFAMFIMFMMERDDKRDDILELKREMQAIKDDNKGIRAYINGGFVKPKPQERK